MARGSGGGQGVEGGHQKAKSECANLIKLTHGFSKAALQYSLKNPIISVLSEKFKPKQPTNPIHEKIAIIAPFLPIFRFMGYP
jgi:hypothetical protein